MKVLLTEADHRATLAAIRALGKECIDVTVAGQSKCNHVFYSKYCKARRYYRSPKNDVDSFISDILEIIKKEHFDVLLPMGIETTIPMSLHKERLQQYVNITVPDYETLIKAHNKSITVRIANDLGIPVPKSFFPRNMSDVKEIAHSIEYPAVIKSRKGTGAKGVTYVYSAGDLLRSYAIGNGDEAGDIYDDTMPLIQEYIPGELHDLVALFSGGEPKVFLTQRRLKTLPPTGGGGIVNITTDEPEIASLGLKLLKAIKWHGVAMVDFKIDSRDNTPKVLEINPKFWGTLALSIAAGINFPYLACKLAMGDNINGVFEYRKGLKYRWIIPDELMYLAKTKGKLSALAEFFNFGEANTESNIWLSDIKPNIMVMVDIICQVLTRQRKLRDLL